MFELTVIVALGTGINELGRFCVAINVTSLVLVFYHDIDLAIKTIWQYLGMVRASIKDVPLNPPKSIPTV